MSAPRVEVDLDAIGANAAVLVAMAADRGIGVTAVTKAVLGHPAVARVLVAAGVAGLGDARIDNVERLRAGGVDAPIVLVRSPLPSQVDRVVAAATTSCNTEPEVLTALAGAARAAGVVHGVVVMVELGDLREGVLPEDLPAVARHVGSLPGLALAGIGANLACRSGVVPDDRNMAELSALAGSLEADLGVSLAVVSGGSSANLDWLRSTADVGRIDDLRLGEAIYLGCEPLHRRPVPGLRTDAVRVVAEVIESRRKPSVPWGRTAEGAFGPPLAVLDQGERWQTGLAIGEQDTDPAGLVAPPGVRVLGASSDHLVVATEGRLAPGTEVAFVPTYAALLRAMAAPSVAVRLLGERSVPAAPTRPA